MLNYFLLQLAGPQRKSLTVKDPEKYEFKPKQLLKQVPWMERFMLDNLLLSCVSTVREDDAEKALYCDTVAATGVGAARLTCSTVSTCSGRHRVSPVCYLVTVTACVLELDG